MTSTAIGGGAAPFALLDGGSGRAPRCFIVATSLVPAPSATAGRAVRRTRASPSPQRHRTGSPAVAIGASRRSAGTSKALMRKLCLVVLCGLPVACLAQRIERPTPRPGDECRYDVIDNLHGSEKIAERRMVVTSVASGRISISVTHRLLVTRDTGDLTDRTLVMDEDLNVIEQDGVRFAQPYPRRMYPLEPGLNRDGFEIEFPGKTGTSRTESLDARVGAWQTRTVPAGRFEVLSLRWKGWYNGRSPLYRWSGRMQRDIAFSPASWCEVSSTEQIYAPNSNPWSHRDFVLTGFTPVKAEPPDRSPPSSSEQLPPPRSASED